MSNIRHVSDFSKGYFRKESAKNVYYENEYGKKIVGQKIISRIERLVIPPAWKDVWISRDPQSHILAFGFDDKFRKQYIYHPHWTKQKQEQKYGRVIELGTNLPAIRRQIKKDLSSTKLSKRWVLALIVRVLDKTGIRIGNEKYTQRNETYGLTTLRKKHVETTGESRHDQEIIFHFTGKSHKEQEYHIMDQSIIDDIHALDDLPGREIFHYRDDRGNKQVVTPQDVNEYIDQIAGVQYSAKDFRTWRGTTCAVGLLLRYIDEEKFPLPKKYQSAIVGQVAKELGNTPAVSREHYIHPRIQKLFESKVTPQQSHKQVQGLSDVEQVTLGFLK